MFKLLDEFLFYGQAGNGPLYQIPDMSGKIDKLCHLISTEKKEFGWERDDSIDKSDFGEIKFKINGDLVFIWHMDPTHFSINTVGASTQEEVTRFKDIFTKDILESNSESEYMLLPWVYDGREVGPEFSASAKKGINSVDLILSESFSKFYPKINFIKFILENKIVFNLSKLEDDIHKLAAEDGSYYEGLYRALQPIDEEYCLKIAKSKDKAMVALMNYVKNKYNLVELLEKGGKTFIESALKLDPAPKQMDLEECLSNFRYLFKKEIPPESLEYYKPNCSHVDFSIENLRGGRSKFYPIRVFFSPDYKNYWDYLTKLFPSILKNEYVQERIGIQ
jgi:hypothetical protein